MSDAGETPLSARGSEDAAEQLRRLWQQGRRPDVADFLVQAGPLSPAQVTAVLRVDQRERWRCGERIPAEGYLERHPEVRSDPEAALDLVFNEFLLREQLGERPPPGEYLQRFPAFAAGLGPRIDLHRALGSLPSAAAAPPTPGPASESPAPNPAAGPSSSDATRLAPRSEDTPPPPMLPAEFGRYRILRLLGQGGMGTVYLAHDTELDRPVALKVPRFREGADARVLERFYREARIAATFTHPQLCPVYDVGRIDGIHYLTMPYLTGESLSAWLAREGPLPERTAARFAALIARALAVAHRAGVIHRDLKPANVMVNESREPIVMDFGLARGEVSRSARVTASGALLGTPAYMPPEQIGGDPAAIGPGCDIYSLGVLLYEMLTGRLPFEGSLHQLLRQVLVQEPEPPSRYRPGLDPRLEAVCRTALAKEPSQRFASMEAFARALDEYLQNSTDPPPAVPSAPSVRPQRVASPGSATPVWPERPRPSPDAEPKPVPIAAPPVRLRSRKRVVVVFVSLAAAVLAGLAWTAASLRNRSAAPGSPVDDLPAGSRWSGTFQFRPLPQGHRGDVQVTITERTGDHFVGVYTTEAKRYEWLIEGTVRGSAIRWGFTRANRGPGAAALVGKGWVEGTCADAAMTVTFHDPNDNSVAEMTLQRLR